MSVLRDVLIPGTVTQAMKLGEVWRKAGRDAPKAVADAGNGAFVFEGTIRTVHYETVDGFTVGDIHITAPNGDTMRVSVKNENMACWINDAVYATIPDLICLFDSDTGAPIANPDCTENQNVSVLILPAPAPFLTAAGLSSFGPHYAGIDADFHTPLRDHAMAGDVQ